MPNAYIIAEIGTGHGGDLTRAKELIQAAAESGADCAKFQCVIAGEIVHPDTPPISLPGGPTDIYDRFKEVEREPAFYSGLKELCGDVGIDFLCTVFGKRSAHIIEQLAPEAHKIASPESNHIDLIKLISSYNRPLYLSTGVTALADIELALQAAEPKRTTLLHCITAYPAPESQYNVRIIPLLRDLFGVAVGVSDHSQDPGLVPGLAVALGATTVEKHFTIDRHGSGLDDPIAMDPIMFTEMAATIRRVEGLLGDDPNAEALVIEQFKSEYGAQRVNAVLGTGRKALAAAESDNYATTRRSLIATRSVNAGEVLSDDAVAPLRAESLSPGLDPAILSVVRGARLTKALSSGEGLTWEHLLSRRRD